MYLQPANQRSTHRGGPQVFGSHNSARPDETLNFWAPHELEAGTKATHVLASKAVEMKLRVDLRVLA
jgi:hypothetical protein